ncbi:MAG: hypothetical protein ACRCTY_10620, partial [Candidatus Adiutrix sp.]
AAEPPPQFKENKPHLAPPPPFANQGIEDENKSLGLGAQSDEGERPKALIVHDTDATISLLIEKLSANGYDSIVATNMRDAAKQIKFTKFNLLLLQENYYGTSLGGNQLLRAIQNIDTQQRRGMLVILISPSMITLDDLTAFALSIEAIININDLNIIERIIVSTVARAKKFYAAYSETLLEQGFD